MGFYAEKTTFPLQAHELIGKKRYLLDAALWTYLRKVPLTVMSSIVNYQ